MLQCVTVGGASAIRKFVVLCCSVMQCVAVCCSLLQCVAVPYSVVACADTRLPSVDKYGVATISRLLRIIGLFCRISSL